MTAFIHVGDSICSILAAWVYYAKSALSQQLANIVNVCKQSLTWAALRFDKKTRTLWCGFLR
ncbi:hypothetical protein AAX07_11170 [Moraxella bovoculi]|nr:hypothetical protein AAX07_11170 [Moraxella bovoculi]